MTADTKQLYLFHLTKMPFSYAVSEDPNGTKLPPAPKWNEWKLHRPLEGVHGPWFGLPDEDLLRKKVEEQGFVTFELLIG